MGWRAVWALAVGLFLVRVAYHLWLSPFELAGDEAHYWDWSRHLALSYYSKGPGVAWAIWASTSIFGHAEWAIRLPAAIASLVATLAIARLAQRCAGGDARVAFLGAVAFCLVPAFQATSMLMTIDMPYIACWALAALAAWEMIDRQDAGRSGVGWAALLGLAIGVGFLFKYTMLLLLPGLLLYRLLRPARTTAARGLIASVACALVAGIVAQPVLLWNQQHGWPTVAHLLGHLGMAGGDLPPDHAPGGAWTPRWFLEFAGAQIAIVGPIIVLMIGAIVRALARARQPGRDAAANAFLACCAAPIVLIYLGVSLINDAEGNWALAGYTTAGALVATRAPTELTRYHALVRRWRTLDPPRPRQGILRRKPETGWQIAWHWSIGYALVAGIGMLALAPLGRVPLLADVVPTHRLMGHAERAETLENALRATHGTGTRDALVIAHRYDEASRMAYHLFRSMGADAPTVTSGSRYLGDRASSYDYWPETSVNAPRWRGATILLYGGGQPKWERGFRFERVERWAEGSPILIGFGYGGPAQEPVP
jgi:hypothetical protein